MSLKATIASGVLQAFTAAQDLVSLGTYSTRGTSIPVYDPVNDTYVSSSANTVTNVRMLRTSLTDEEREASSVTVSDAKVLIPAVDLPGVRPSETDTIQLDGVGYNVLSVKTVPGDSLWILFVREK